MNEFTDKVVLVTGAGRGDGRDVSMAFSSLGAVIAANDINPISLDETVNQIIQAGGKASSYVYDVAKRMPIEAMVAQVVDQYGRIDILINHASVKPDVHLLEMDEWEFYRTLEVNLGGPFFTMQQVGRVMRQQGGGVIVNLISMVDPASIQKGLTAYLASQAGQIGLIQAAAGELSSYNIRLNSVMCGSMSTETTLSPNWDFYAYQEWLKSFLAIKPGETSDLVRMVLFLCSVAARGLTGQVISISSGRS